MKIFIVLIVFVTVLFACACCKSNDSSNIKSTSNENSNPKDTSSNQDDESAYFLKGGNRKFIKPDSQSVIAISDISDKALKISDYHSDYEINDKEYTADEFRKYLNGLSRSKLKYGILMTYIKGGSDDNYSETVLKHFCLKNDVDLFTHAPVNRMPMSGELYPNDYAGWANKSSISYYAKDEFYNKVYMNGLGETAEDKLPKNVLKITESETEHYIIDGKKYTAKELKTYLNEFKFEDLEDGILLTMNNVKKDEEACFYTLNKFAGALNVDLYLKKSFVKEDSPKFGKIQHLVRSSRSYIRKMLSQLEVKDNLVLSMLTSYKSDADYTRARFYDKYASSSDSELVNSLYEQLDEHKMYKGIDLYRRLESSIEDTCFPKIVMFCIKNDVNIFLNADRKVKDKNSEREEFLENWYYKAIKPLHFDYDFMNKVYNNGVNEVLLTELPENILTFTELDTPKYKASDKEYNAEELKKYLKSLDADVLKSGILLKTNKTKKDDFPCFLVLEDFCVLNDVKLYIQRPTFDEKSLLNKRAFIYSNKIKKQAQELEKTLDSTKNEILLARLSGKSTLIEIDEYFSETDWENMKQALAKINKDEPNYGVIARLMYRDKFTHTKALDYLRDFCKKNDLDLFVFNDIYRSKRSTNIKGETVAIWDVKSSKSPYLDDDYMRKVHENGK